MIDVLNDIPIAATVFAVPQFLPQIRKLRATRDTAGVSWSWAALTSVNNAAWIAYFTLEHYWTALIPSSSATFLAGTLTLLLTVRGRASLRPSLLIGTWAALLVTAYLVAGRAGLGPPHRRVRRAGHAVDLDRLPDGPPHRRLIRHLAAHPRRADLLDDLRAVQIRSAPDHPRRHRRDGQRAHAGADSPGP